jgi:hypothetical protein
MRNLTRFFKAVSVFESMVEDNPWHDSRTGEFGGDRGSWSLTCDPRARPKQGKGKCAGKGKKTQAGDDKFAGKSKSKIGVACGSHARGMGKDIRCHDQQDI